MKKKNMFILFYLLLSCNFIYLLPISIWNSLRILSVISIVLFIFKLNEISIDRGRFNNIIIMIFALCVVEIIISLLSYNQSIKEVIGTSLYYFNILFYYQLRLNRESCDYLDIEKYIIIISSLISILQSVQYYMYINFGLKFLSIDFENNFRFDEIRINANSFLIGIGIILLISKLLTSNKLDLRNKITYYALIFINSFCLIYVGKSRGILGYLLVTILFMYIILKRGIVLKIKLIIIVSLGIFIIMKLPIMDKYINLINDDDGSTITRDSAITFYTDQIKSKPVLGMGIINAMDKKSKEYKLIRGPYGKFFRDDVGIWGYCNEFGLSGLILYLGIIVKLFRIVIVHRRNKELYKYIDKVGLLIFIILSSNTLIVMNGSRICYLPFILFIFEGKRD